MGGGTPEIVLLAVSRDNQSEHRAPTVAAHAAFVVIVVL